MANVNCLYYKNYKPPIVIGGVGGSGTRLVANILQELDFFLGSDLNNSQDNLTFTLLFRYLGALSCSEKNFEKLLKVFFKGMLGDKEITDEERELIKYLASKDRDIHNSEWLANRAFALFQRQKELPKDINWGWKSPFTHILLPRLKEHLTDFKYIHVARNGLDMSHSKNQNQLKSWGRLFINGEIENSPLYSLKYWCAVHKNILEVGKSLNDNFLFLNFDDLCTNPELEINRLLKFLSLDAPKKSVMDLSNLVSTPKSKDRYLEYGLNIFDRDDVAYVKSIGFKIIGD